MKRGDIVRIVDENDCRDDDVLGNHEFEIGTEVELLRYDAGDDSWLVVDKTNLRGSAWVYEACLTEAAAVTPREVAEAIASIKRAATDKGDA